MFSRKQEQLFGVAMLACAAIFFATPSTAQAGAVLSAPGCTANVLPRNDDNYSGSVPLGFDFFFGGEFYSSLNINNNGYVIFGSQVPIWFVLHSWLLFNVPLIAMFHADVDTRAPGSSEVTYGPITYAGHPALCVNWVNVGYFNLEDNLLNSFQLILVSRSDRGAGDADIYLNYDRIVWDTADGNSASLAPRAGIYDGSVIVNERPGSNAHGTLLDSNPNGLTQQSAGSPVLGQYVYQLQGGLPPTTAVITGTALDTNGAPMSGAVVQACQSGCLGANTCVFGSANGQGRYSLTSFPVGAIDECPTWTVTVSPPAGSQALQNTRAVLFTAADQIIADADVVLAYPTQVPSGTSIVPSRGGGWGGAPTVFWGEPLTLTTSGCGSILGGTPPIATYSITQAGNPVRGGTMAETSFGSGVYVATVAALMPIHGQVTVTMTLTCPDENTGDELPPLTGTSSFDLYIDPSGFVRTTHGVALVGAQVTLYRADTAIGPFQVVTDGSAIMSPKNRNNPDYTDSSGHFGWDTLAGFYVVRAEFPGCVSPSSPERAYVETDVLEVPPAWLDLLLTLDCEAITPPELSLPTQVLAAATSTAGALVSYQATAHDGRDGDVPVTCTPASGGQFPLGVTLVTCSASDSSGNVAHGAFPVTVSYAWSNVLPPLRADGTNRIQRGRTVPVEFALTGASARIKNLVATLYLAPVVNGVPGAEVPARSAGRDQGGRFRYEAREREYEFEWSTRGLAAGHYQLRVELGDGVSHTVAVELRGGHRDDDDDGHGHDHDGRQDDGRDHGHHGR